MLVRGSTRAQLESARAAIDEAEGQARAAVLDARRLRAALDTLPVGVVVADAAGVEVARNRPATALAGSGPAGVIADHAVATMLAGAVEGVSKRDTIELHGPPPRTLVITAGPVGAGDQSLGAVAVIEDITDRRLLESVRRDFVANVSHELRTPVGALAALAEALSDESDLGVMRSLAARIGAEADRATQVIEDLLDLSRIETGGAVELDRVHVATVVSAAVQRVQARAEERAIRLVLATVDPTVVVIGDERQLVSALANLLDNAVKYSDEGSNVEVSVAATGDVVRLAVRDEGIGIPTRELERIFERFYRVDRARSRQTGGTGLGLAIVRHVARNHGGAVLVDSREGEGSMFTLVIPAA